MHLKKSLLLTALCVLAAASCYSQKKKDKKDKNEISLNNKADSISYSLGVSTGQNVKSQGLDSINAEVIARAIRDVYSSNKLLISPDEANKILSDYFKNIQGKKGEVAKVAGKKFLDENKTKPGVVTLPSGLQYMVIKEGVIDKSAMTDTVNTPVLKNKPALTDKVTTHYHGTLIDGTVFDSSVQRGQPASFPVNGVIKGWTEALQLMTVGSKWKLFIPYELAYGEKGAGKMIGPFTTLIFEVELISIDK